MEYIGVFQGGGIKGLAYIGAICALEDYGITCLKSAGTSIGAVFASLLACGYSGRELAYLSKEINFSSLLYMPSKKISTLIYDKGLYDSSIIEYELNYLYNYKGYNIVSDLFINDETKLKVVVSDLTKKRAMIFPDMLNEYGINKNNISIARMVTMSILYPGFFKALKLGNSTIVDGGVMNNFPLDAYEIEKNEFGIAFQILNRPKKFDNTNYKLIKINTNNTKTLQFKVNYQDKKSLFENGYSAGIKFIEENYFK